MNTNTLIYTKNFIHTINLIKLMKVKSQTKKDFWWIIKTKPLQELTAIEELKKQGFVSYCPLIQKETRRNNQFKIRSSPLFSSYIFIEANEYSHINIHLIRSTRGVSYLIKNGESPAKIPSDIVEIIKKQQSQSIEKINKIFTQGNSVKITKGIYKDLEAIYDMDDGLDRAIILLTIIQKKTKLKIKKQDLIKLN